MNNFDFAVTKESSLKIGKYVLHYDNEEATTQTIEEVFDDLPYIFHTDKKEPFIIDGGSNIGISCLYFKIQYPEAKILCFEPDPHAFSLLTKNIMVNKLQNVTLINAALAKTTGKINFYGQLNLEHPDARGNSIIDVWGLQRKTSTEIVVDAVNLSKYINCEVDFLKLDIEGAEEQVLEEIKDHLQFVKSIAIEAHQADQMNDLNDVKKIVSLLEHGNFDVSVLEKPTSVMPDAIKEWVKRQNPSLYLIKGNKQI